MLHVVCALAKRAYQPSYDRAEKRLGTGLPRRAQPCAAGMKTPLGDELLIAAQSLFMCLPLCSLWAKRAGAPMSVHPPQLVAMGCAIVAFALLVVMFYLAHKPLGLGLCAANFGLRLVEAARTAQLVRRQKQRNMMSSELLN